MARTKGSRSAGYAARRAALLTAFQARLVAPDAGPPSLRELAAAAGVSVATVRHYFGQREDVIVALLTHLGAAGADHLAHTATAELSFAASIAELTHYIAAGFRFGLAEIHVLGLREGLRHSVAGPAYLGAILEPTLAAVETRLAAHQAAGDMRSGSARHAALALVSPVLLAALHQGDLGGRALRPLEDSFIDDHVASFVRAFRAMPGDAGQADD